MVSIIRLIPIQLLLGPCLLLEIAPTAFAGATSGGLPSSTSASNVQISVSSVSTGSKASERSGVTHGPTSYPNEASHRASDFLNSLGINLDMSQPSYRYNVNAIVSDLSYIGFKHVRGTIGSFSIAGNSYYINSKWVMPASFTNSRIAIPAGPAGKNAITSQQMLKMFTAAGIHVDVHVYPEDPTPYQTWLDANTSYVEYIEGVNEVNTEPNTITYNGLTQMALGITVQKALYSMVKSDPKLSSIPVYAMTIGNATPSVVATAGNIAPYTDYANLHAYAGSGSPPYAALAGAMALTTDAHGKPFVMTETGYPTAVYNATVATTRTSGKNIVSEDIQNKYVLDAIFDAFNLGYVKTYLYELIDYQCDPYYTNSEMHFGIFRCDNHPKPAAIGLHNLEAILQDQGPAASTFAPAPLNFTMRPWLRGSAHDIETYHTLLQKEDGTYDLVLWGEPNLWSTWSHAEITTGVPVNLVTISFSSSYQSIKIYDPVKSAFPTEQVLNTNQIEVPVTDHPLIIEIGRKL